MIITIQIEKEDIPYILDALEQRASRYGADIRRCANGYGTVSSQQKALNLRSKKDKVVDLIQRIHLQTYDY